MFGLVFMPNGRQTVGRVASVMAAVQVYMARSGSTYAGRRDPGRGPRNAPPGGGRGCRGFIGRRRVTIAPGHPRLHRDRGQNRRRCYEGRPLRPDLIRSGSRHWRACSRDRDLGNIRRDRSPKKVRRGYRVNAFKGGTRGMLRGLARLLREQAAACLLHTAKSSQILIANFALALGQLEQEKSFSAVALDLSSTNLDDLDAEAVASVRERACGAGSLASRRPAISLQSCASKSPSQAHSR